MEQLRTEFGTFFSDVESRARQSIDALYAAEHLLILRYAGPGIGLHNLIKRVPGSGDFLISALDSNAKRVTMEGLRRPIRRSRGEGFASLSVAAGHAAVVRFEGEKALQENEEQDLVPKLLSMGIAGAIRSRDAVPDGGFCAHIALRYLKHGVLETAYVSLQLPAEGMTRDDHEHFVALTALNMLLHHVQLPQIELPSMFGVESEEMGQRSSGMYQVESKILRASLTEDILKKHQALLMRPNGTIVPLTREVFNPEEHVIVASAVKPLTLLHDHLGQMAVLYPDRIPGGFRKKRAAFLLNRSNANPQKAVTWDEFLQQLDQFVGLAPVVILNGFGTFADQAKLFQELVQGTPIQVIGGDKLRDIINYPNYPAGLAGAFDTLEKSGQLFLVVDRGDDTYERGRKLCPEELRSQFDRLFTHMRIAFAHFSDGVSSSSYRTAEKRIPR